MHKKIKNLLFYNFKTLIGFELIYKLLSTLIFVPIFLFFFSLITKISGYSYITLDNVSNFLLNPLTIIFLIILLTVITFYTFIDISTIIVILDSAYQKKKITIKDAFLIGLKKSLKVFNYHNILLIFLVLFLIPFLHIGISSSFASTIAIPEFILDFILNNRLLTTIYVVIVCALMVLFFRWLYIIHYFILEDCSFRQAHQKSINLSSKHRLIDFLSIVLMQIIIATIYLLIVFGAIYLIIFVYKKMGEVAILGNLAITIIWLFIAISFVIILLLTTPISYALISCLYYSHKEKNKEVIKHIKVSEKIKIPNSRKIIILKYSIATLVIILACIFTYAVLNGKYDLNIEYLTTTEVTAHRGASAFYPENTMSAFKGAKELGTDWIELDVQQTKDHKLVILHDANLKRTTGLNKNTWDATYDEISTLDAGSFFGKEFKGEKIPTLEEVIIYAKDNNIKLNIELKPTGHEENFEKEVVDMIKKYHFENNCLIASLNYEVLENVKKYDASMPTLYVMSLAYGNLLDFKAADNFSIEASSITKTLVDNLHENGKAVFAWTVNTEDAIKDLIRMNVDNIITDNITLAQEVIYNCRTSNLIIEYINEVNKLLA